jgi:LysM repeat protein
LENDRGSFRWAGGEKRQEVIALRQVTVQPGDTLRGIAKQVGASFEEIARINGIQNPDLIYPGQVLNVPGGAAGCGGGGGGVGNFGQSARNVRLVDGGRRLEAELLRDGKWVGSSMVLDERIGNDNGTLTFKS